MAEYMDRCIDRLVERDLGIFGAVLIQGPKWCGKTTTSQRFAASSLSLSNPAGGFAALQLARLDPAQAIVGPTPRLIDEWQEEPKIWDAVRFECDRRMGEPGQFLLTGSATPNDASRPMHSGVGRVSRLRMDTMTLLELGISSGSVSLGALLAEKPTGVLLDQSKVSPPSRTWCVAAVGRKPLASRLKTPCVSPRRMSTVFANPMSQRSMESGEIP